MITAKEASKIRVESEESFESKRQAKLEELYKDFWPWFEVKVKCVAKSGAYGFKIPAEQFTKDKYDHGVPKSIVEKLESLGFKVEISVLSVDVKWE
jgi:hypothetical protein